MARSRFIWSPQREQNLRGSPKIIPVIEPLSDLQLPEGYSLPQKWNCMNNPNEPDHKTTKIAISGLELVWIQEGG